MGRQARRADLHGGHLLDAAQQGDPRNRRDARRAPLPPPPPPWRKVNDARPRGTLRPLRAHRRARLGRPRQPEARVRRDLAQLPHRFHVEGKAGHGVRRRDVPPPDRERDPRGHHQADRLRRRQRRPRRELRLHRPLAPAASRTPSSPRGTSSARRRSRTTARRSPPASTPRSQTTS